MNFKTVEIRGGRGRLCYGEKPFVDLRRGGYLTKPWNRNPDLEVLFIPHLMLRFPPILAGV